MSALRRVLRRIEHDSDLDRVAGPLAELLPAVFRRHPVADVLRGSWLGHPAHPAVVLAPAGIWIASAVLDCLPGQGTAARRLIGVGLLTVPAAVATGLAEYTTLNTSQRRTAVVHVSANTLAACCYLLSHRLRGRDRQWAGRLLGMVGLAAVGLGGLLGGHLSYVQGAGVRG
ncbi:DUF2231 domain-containing protein [Goodfellowiella coeruleoviolacea]|uniref:Membrane protein n=1 Tax=Goodfellowiella coeruleoviolacea TaxID=334858 RepID=A0AAE3GML9_9PSEU|nr:DUF2231 domain-containing protein [Goodfellowiella coeruleoviolacea]MCP2170400.1 putative membrane protein [Goodfellowiella coeruleoviolacea]